MTLVLAMLAFVAPPQNETLPIEKTAKDKSEEVNLKLRTSADVFLSSPAYSFDTQFTALILQPTGSNLSYAAEAIPLPLPSPDWKIQNVKPEYHFGFDLLFEGIFHTLYSTATLDWQHFHSSDSNSKTTSTSNMIGPFFEIGPDASPYKKALGRAVFHFDAVNLNYGVFVNFGKRLRTNLFGGIGFARIHQTLHQIFSDLTGTIVRRIETPSTFMGFGPELGLSFGYCVMSNFRLTGETSISLLVGNLKDHTRFQTSSAALAPLGITPPNRQSTKEQKRTQFVPGFEGRLGFSYSMVFRKHYYFKLEAGYQAQIYLNAIQSTDMGSEVNTPPISPNTVGVYARTFHRTQSNFALAGPYANLSLGF